MEGQAGGCWAQCLFHRKLKGRRWKFCSILANQIKENSDLILSNFFLNSILLQVDLRHQFAES